MTARLAIVGTIKTISLTAAEYRPPKSLVLSGPAVAGSAITITLRVTPDGDSSRLEMRADFVGNLIVGVIGAAVAQEAAQALGESLRKVATLITD